MDASLEKKLYVALCAYLNTCSQSSRDLWEKIAGIDLLKPRQKEDYFIASFEGSEEFGHLAATIGQCLPRPPKADDPNQHYEYRGALTGLSHWFLVNTGAYDAIIGGKALKIEKLHDMLVEALEKEEEEHIQYGEVFPLRIETADSEALEFKTFGLLKTLRSYDIGTETNFVFLVQRRCRRNPPVCGYSSAQPDKAIPIVGETPFSSSLLLLNLYFSHAVYVPRWHEAVLSVLSQGYQPRLKSVTRAGTIRSGFTQELWQKYNDEALDVAFSYEDGVGYVDWDKYLDFMDEREQEFIESDVASIRRVRGTELCRFKKFIVKCEECLAGDQYSNQMHLRIASQYFIEAHERPEFQTRLVNYVIALEALYFSPN